MAGLTLLVGETMALTMKLSCEESKYGYIEKQTKPKKFEKFREAHKSKSHTDGHFSKVKVI